MYYLYQAPFVISKRGDDEQVLAYVDEYSDKILSLIQQEVLKFAIKEKLVDTNGDILIRSRNERTGSWIYLLTWTDFRSLVLTKNRTKIINALTTDDSAPINTVLNFHMQLGVLFDHVILNTLCHRIMTAISLIPYPVGSDDEQESWETIHRTHPWLWVLILIQVIIVSNTVKVAE